MTTKYQLKYQSEPVGTLTPRKDAFKKIMGPPLQGFKEEFWLDEPIKMAIGVAKEYDYDEAYNWREDPEVKEFGMFKPSLFDSAQNKHHALSMKTDIEKSLSNAHQPGYMIGKIAGIFSDPFILGAPYIMKSVWKINRLSRLQKAATIGATMGGLETIAEGFRQSSSLTRPAEISYFAIAGVGTISGLLGGLFAQSSRLGRLANDKKLIHKIAKKHDDNMTVMEQRLDPPSRFYKQENNGNVTTVQLPPKINKIIKKRDVQIKQEPIKTKELAQYNIKTGEITYDAKKIYNAFKTSKVQNQSLGGKKVKDLFSTPQEYLGYIVRHEVTHARYPRKSGESIKVYEDRIHKIALKEYAAETPYFMTPDFTQGTYVAQQEQNQIIRWLTEQGEIFHWKGIVLDVHTKKHFSDKSLGKLKKMPKYEERSAEHQLVKTGLKIERIPDNPQKRLSNQASITAREATQILDNPGLLEMHKMGKGYAQGGGNNGERFVKKFKGMSIQNNMELDQLWAKYKTRIKKEQFGNKQKIDDVTDFELTRRRLGMDFNLTFKGIGINDFKARTTAVKINPKLAYVDGKFIPEIMEGAKIQAKGFYGPINDILFDEGIYVAQANNQIAEINAAFVRMEAGKITRTEVIRKKGIDVEERYVLMNGKEFGETTLKNFQNYWEDILKSRQTKVDPEFYFPLVKNQTKIMQEKDKFIKIVKAQGLEDEVIKAELAAIEKHNYFKPYSEATVGWASSLHKRKSKINWKDPKLIDYLIHDPRRLQQYYARSMGADIWLSRFNRQYYKKSRIAREGKAWMKGKTPDEIDEIVKTNGTKNNLRDMLDIVNNDYINFAKALGAKLQANPYSYEFQIHKIKTGKPLVVKGGKVKSKEEISDPNLFFGKAKIEKNVDDLIDISKNNPNAEKIQKILSERKATLRDVKANRDLLKGTFGLADDPSSTYSSIIRSIKQINTLTMLTGLLSAAVDTARIVGYAGFSSVFRKELLELTTSFPKWKKMAKLTLRDLNKLEEASDLHISARARIMADLPEHGTYTSKMEGVLDQMSQFNFAYVNMMSTWNRYMKQLTGVYWQSKVIPLLIKYGKGEDIGALWRGRLARSGLPITGEGSKITKQIAKELNAATGTIDGRYIQTANIDAWKSQEAIEAFTGAMAHDVSIVIVTPGKGDVALWMNTELGGLLSQFKKFSQAATNRVLMAGLQEGKKEFMEQAIYLLAIGAFVDYMRTSKGFEKDYTKKPFGSKVYDAIERSALLGYLMDVDKTAMALSNNRIGLEAILGIGPNYPTSLSRKLGITPVGGQLGNLGSVFTDIGLGNYDFNTARNVRRLLPFQNVFWLDSIFDDIEKGLRL